LLLFVFIGVAAMWISRGLGGFIPNIAPSGPLLAALTFFSKLDYAIPPMVGVGALLVSGVLEWRDLISERPAWDVFIWYGGLVRMAEALGETGITKRFA